MVDTENVSRATVSGNANPACRNPSGRMSACCGTGESRWLIALRHRPPAGGVALPRAGDGSAAVLASRDVSRRAEQEQARDEGDERNGGAPPWQARRQIGCSRKVHVDFSKSKRSRIQGVERPALGCSLPGLSPTLRPERRRTGRPRTRRSVALPARTRWHPESPLKPVPEGQAAPGPPAADRGPPVVDGAGFLACLLV